MKTKSYLLYPCLSLMLGLGLETETRLDAADATSVAPIPGIKIDRQPEDVLARYGEPATFGVKAGPDAATYQWSYNLIDLPGETRPILKIAKVAKKHLGAYSCVISMPSNEGQPEARRTEIVSLTAYHKIGTKIILEGMVVPIFSLPYAPSVDMLVDPNARISPLSPELGDSPLIYAVGGARNARYVLGADRHLLQFASASTNQFTIDYLPPAGGSGSASGCVPAYKCYFNFRKTVAPYGWLPAAGVTSGTARHLQSSQTVVKWFVGVTKGNCGTGGMVTVPFTSSTDAHRFTVYCPSSTFSTCLTGVQQLELTGFQP